MQRWFAAHYLKWKNGLSEMGLMKTFRRGCKIEGKYRPLHTSFSLGTHPSPSAHTPLPVHTSFPPGTPPSPSARLLLPRHTVFSLGTHFSLCTFFLCTPSSPSQDGIHRAGDMVVASTLVTMKAVGAYTGEGPRVYHCNLGRAWHQSRHVRQCS